MKIKAYLISLAALLALPYSVNAAQSTAASGCNDINLPPAHVCVGKPDGTQGIYYDCKCKTTVSYTCHNGSVRDADGGPAMSDDEFQKHCVVPTGKPRTATDFRDFDGLL